MTNLLLIGPRHVAELRYCRPILVEILALAVKQWPNRLPIVTSVHRTAEENARSGAVSKVHVVGPPYRAIDVSGKNISWGEVARVANYINKRYEYDSSRPHAYNVAVSARHGTGPHLHIQVTGRTTKRRLKPRDEDMV